MDEREKKIAFQVIAFMYFITLLSITGIVIYRQFALAQTIHDFQDIGVILTFNSIFLVSALLYFGAIPLRKLSIKTILLAFGLIVVLGCLFVFIKYNLIQDPALTFGELLNKMVIVCTISGLLVAFFIVFSLLGNRKMEKEIRD